MIRRDVVTGIIQSINAGRIDDKTYDVAVKVSKRILTLWSINEKDQNELLGINKASIDKVVTVLCASRIINIYRRLNTIFSDSKQADAWMMKPNKRFNGISAFEYMRQGKTQLEDVQIYLSSQSDTDIISEKSERYILNPTKAQTPASCNDVFNTEFEEKQFELWRTLVTSNIDNYPVVNAADFANLIGYKGNNGLEHINKLVYLNKLFGFVHEGILVIPLFQVNQHRKQIYPVLQDVLHFLNCIPDEAKYAWFCTQNSLLGCKPAEAIKDTTLHDALVGAADSRRRAEQC